MEFTGFETIKNLLAGDLRQTHNVGISQTDVDDIYSNRVTIYVECGRDLVGFTKFKRTDPPEDIENWVNHVLFDHKQNCPMIERVTIEIPRIDYNKFKEYVDKREISMEDFVFDSLYQCAQDDGVVLD